MLKINQVMELTTLSRASIYRYIKERGFPAPIPLSPYRVAWEEEAAREWIKKTAANAPTTEEKTNDSEP